MSEPKKLIVKKETSENVKKPTVKTDIKTGRPAATCKASGSCCDAGSTR